MDDAYAVNTKRCYQSAERRYLQSCISTGHHPWPVTLDAIRWWHSADHLEGKNARSIKQDGSNLRSHCRSQNISFLEQDGDPQRYKEYINGLLANETRPTKRPPPVMAADILAIADTVDMHKPRQMQLWLMLMLARGGLLRASEVCGTNLRRRHIHDEGRGIWRVDVLKTKTSRRSAEADPFWVIPAVPTLALTTRQNRLLDTASLLANYLRTTQLKPDAPLFPALTTAGQPDLPYKSMSYNAWLTKFKKVCKAAGIEKRSLHAIRAGGATDLHIQGISSAMVKKAGRWVTDSTASHLYNRPGMVLATVVQRAHLDEIVAAAKSTVSRQR
jgi:integrase